MNCKSEYDRMIGELSQTTTTPGTRHQIYLRKRGLLPLYLHIMPNTYGINYTGLNPRPTYKELTYLEDYPDKYHEKSATFTRDSPLQTQFDGIGMMELEAQ